MKKIFCVILPKKMHYCDFLRNIYPSYNISIGHLLLVNWYLYLINMVLTRCKYGVGSYKKELFSVG